MSVDFFWRLPTHGDGRSVKQQQYSRGDLVRAARRTFTPGLRDGEPDGFHYIDHLAQIAKAAEHNGFYGALVPTGLDGEEPWVVTAALARETNAWFHVDAAYGGALLFSARHKAKLAEIVNADSIAIDFHKLFWQPIPCSAFLLRDARHFDLIKLNADYLNPETHEEAGIPNLVTTSLLTSRRFDALKLWISFQALGREKLAAMIDRTIELAQHAADLIRRSSSLELLADPQLSTVVFRYRPASDAVDADALNARIRQHLFDSGQAVVGHTRVNERQCLKFTFLNPSIAKAHVEELVWLVEAEGNKVK